MRHTYLSLPHDQGAKMQCTCIFKTKVGICFWLGKKVLLKILIMCYKHYILWRLFNERCYQHTLNVYFSTNKIWLSKHNYDVHVNNHSKPMIIFCCQFVILYNNDLDSDLWPRTKHYVQMSLFIYTIKNCPTCMIVDMNSRQTDR